MLLFYQTAKREARERKKKKKKEREKLEGLECVSTFSKKKNTCLPG